MNGQISFSASRQMCDGNKNESDKWKLYPSYLNIPQWFGHALSQENYVILSIIPGCIDFLSGWYPAQEFIFKLIIEDSKLNITQPKPTWISHSLIHPLLPK